MIEQAQLRELIRTAPGFEQTSNIFLSAFQTACAANQLPEFRATCAALFADPASPFCRPYAFAYEARGFMHDYDFWLPPTATEAFRPKPELMNELERCLARPEAINCRDNYYWLIVSGLMEFIRGDMNLAFRQLSLAATYPDLYRIARCDMGGGAVFAKTYPTAADLAAAHATPQFDRQAQFVKRFATPPRFAISMAFDQIYGQAFGGRWIDNVETLASAGVGLHFHAMFRSAVDEALIVDLVSAAAARQVPLAISIEAGVTRSNAYYASARFLKGASVLQQIGCPMVLVDADAFIPDPKVFAEVHLPQMLAETRIMGLLSEGPWNGYLPWRRFSAGWVLCPQSEHARTFLDTTADAIDYFWDSRERNWWIDQMGLEIAKRVSESQHDGPRFGSIYTELPNLFDTSEAYKIEQISRLPAMRARMDGGLNYWEALFDLHEK